MYFEEKQTKTNLQKHFYPSSINYLAQVQCREPKKGQQLVQILKKTTVLCWSVLSISLWFPRNEFPWLIVLNWFEWLIAFKKVFCCWIEWLIGWLTAGISCWCCRMCPWTGWTGCCRAGSGSSGYPALRKKMSCSNFFVFCSFFASGVGFPLYSGNFLHSDTMILLSGVLPPVPVICHLWHHSPVSFTGLIFLI